MKYPTYLLLTTLITLAFSCQSKAVLTENYPELAQIKDSVAHEAYKKLNAIVVYQKGELLIEEYFNGTSKNDIHDARSVGKSITSALLGLAMDNEHIASLDLPLSDFYDLCNYENYDPLKSEIKLRELVTMSSNFDGDDSNMETPGNEEYMYEKPDWVRWTLNLPLDSTRTSGKSWQYFTAGTILIGDILNRSLPMGLEKFSKEKLFGPLGNENYQWSFTPQQVPSTAGNFRTTARGFADFGQMYLNKGQWNGQQVISEKWVEESLSFKIKTHYPSDSYGYYWWIKEMKVNDHTYSIPYCSGNGGNKIYLVEELDAVIVILASAYGQAYGHRQSREIAREFLIPLLERELE